MKTYLTAAAIVTMLATPAFAGMGMPAGSEARGEPLNSSVHASARTPGGYTPGYRAYGKNRSHGVVKSKAPKMKMNQTTKIGH